jgi:hypothetical protein
MDDTLKFALTIFFGLLGWFAVHYFSMTRDRNNKKRDLQTKYLIEAYQKLERNSQNPDYKKEELEAVLADIQLFGHPDEIELAVKFSHDFANKGEGKLGDLLNLLRKNLRKELNLPSANAGIVHLRINQNQLEMQTHNLGENPS